MALRKEILFFAISGVFGFVVDASIVQFLVREWGVNPYQARLVSFLCAATTTWAFNRKITFAGKSGSASRRRQLIRYIIAMAGGFALNYGAYAICVASFPLVREWPAIGVAAGSIAGAMVNFLSSKYFIFKPPKGALAGAAKDPS